MVEVVRVPVGGADDPGGDSLLEAERRANRENPVADTHLLGVADADCLEFARRFDFNNGKICFAVGTDELSSKISAIVKLYPDSIRAFNDVVVGQNITGGVDDHSRSIPSFGATFGHFAP